MYQSQFEESQSINSWNRQSDPKRILIIRFHAIGDVAITFPSCAGLSTLFPNCEIDFLTTESCRTLVEVPCMFTRIHIIPDIHHSTIKLWQTLFQIQKLQKYSYDIVIDLQRNRYSRLMRRYLNPTAWGEFDRFSPIPAGLRTLYTFRKTGLAVNLEFCCPIKPEIKTKATQILFQNGWNGTDLLIVINPAGLWKTRNWPIENYVEFMRLLESSFPVTFLFLGTERIKNKVEFLSSNTSFRSINLLTKTSIGMAFAILQETSAMISEDSGLMHMAWISGIPTIALFGSSRHDWSTPLGAHSVCLHSGDLKCGSCMQPECSLGDIQCLKRRSPEIVFKIFCELTKARTNKV
ncbi:glycosyltransferase family 9 protein [bacterium]|nr:glycosyltransferase family 9 protein [bacterium]